MKKSALLAILTIASCLLNANVAFDIGFFNPKDSKVGILWGLEYFVEIDERISICFTGNYYTREYIESSRVDEQKYETERTARFLPFLAGFKVNIPIEGSPVTPFAGADIGYGFAWERTRVTLVGGEESESGKGKNYNGFTWRINLGATYPLGQMSELYVKALYNGAGYDRNEKIGKSKFDMSGMSAGVGIKFKF